VTRATKWAVALVKAGNAETPAEGREVFAGEVPERVEA
jgi:hypothetical protein